jgi:hypothetical protein
MKKKKTTVPKEHKKVYDYFSKIRKESDQRIEAYFKRVRTEAKEDMERYIGALSEDFQSKLAFVTEHVLATHDAVEEIKLLFMSLGKRVSVLESK